MAQKRILPVEPIQIIRAKTYEKIYSAIGGKKNYNVIIALVIGYKNVLTRHQKKIFRDTGTSHLMAISGMHIGLIAGLVFFVVNALWRLSAFLSLYWPAQKAAGTAGLLGALFYSALSGFAISTERALIMIAFVTLLLLTERQYSFMRVYIISMLLSVICTPGALQTYSFWLSYGAVFFLIYGLSHRVGEEKKWLSYINVQWKITIGMLPLNLFLFHREPLLSPLINIIAIPWVSLVVLPVSLLGGVISLLCERLGDGILQIAVWLFNLFWPVLEKCAQLGYIFRISNCDAWQFAGLLILVLLILAPRGLRPVV